MTIMRKTYTLIVMLVMLFVGANSVKGQVTIDDFTFDFYLSGNAYVKSYNGTATEVTIPATITYNNGDVNVTGIGESAFEGNTTIEKIYLQRNGSFTVGASAFKGCTALKTLRWSDDSGASATYTADNTVYLITATAIESMFEGCTSIVTVQSRYANTALGKNAFKGCTALTSASLGASFTSFGESAFENCTNLATVSCSSSSNTYTLYTRAFKNCTSLTRVGPTEGIVRVGSNTSEPQEEVFMGCTSIKKIAYRYTQTNIGDRWFKGCTGIDSIDFGRAMNIGESAFEGCTSIPNVRFRINTTTTYSISIGKNAFKGCTSIAHVYTHQAVRPISEIGEGAFEGCTSLTAIRNWYIDSGSYKESDLTGIISIGANAFKGCALLTRYGKTANVAIFPDDLTEIGDSAFAGCSSLGTFRLYKMDAAPTLGEGAFTGIKASSYFYINPNNSYKSASKYAKNDGWKVYFNGTKGSHFLIAYVNKEKQYGTVSCDVPLYFYTTTTIANLYKVIASSDNYAYMEAVSSKKLPANTGAVIDVEVDGTVKTSTAVQVLFSTVSATDWSDNLLVANVTENTSFVGNEGNTWNLIMNDGKFVKAIDGTLAGGLAYLPRTFEGGEAKELSLTTDEPTGIKTIDNGEPTVDNGAWYTIDGTRLQGEPTTKGIYIKNGKKIVVK